VSDEDVLGYEPVCHLLVGGEADLVFALSVGEDVEFGREEAVSLTVEYWQIYLASSQ
jgi:hypothetical protein